MTDNNVIRELTRELIEARKSIEHLRLQNANANYMVGLYTEHNLGVSLLEARKIIKRLEQENADISQLAGFYLNENEQLRKRLQPTEEEAEARRNEVMQ